MQKWDSGGGGARWTLATVGPNRQDVIRSSEIIDKPMHWVFDADRSGLKQVHGQLDYWFKYYQII